MSLKINFEIGHEATLRTKNTPEGFTHDWKIFVRGCDGANIHYYVEKVVFYLHETFQKPRRVIKEPPYSVKESGYAGFIIPIEVYLRNSAEPKKIKFSYDLSLQRTGPPLRKVRKEKYIFTSPPEDFKEKLLRGGAIVTSNSQEISENKSILHEEKNQLIGKPKLSGESPSKKPKVETATSNSFQDLFGTPITKTSKVQDPKVSTPSKENKTIVKSDKDRASDKTKNKHSPHKEKEKDKAEKKDKKEEKKKDKERRDKDRDKNKEKNSKMERSPKVRSPSPKNPSPKPSSPPQPTQSTSAEKYREKDNKNEKEKKDKGDEEEKRIKKEKKERESIREKEKHRDRGESKHKEMRIKEASLPEESAAAPGLLAESEMKENKQEKKDNQKEDEKPKTERADKSEEKKHKHKKRDKHKKERKDEDEKTTKVPERVEEEQDQFNHTDQLFSNASSQSLVIDTSESNNLFGSDENLEQTSAPRCPIHSEEAMDIPSLPPSYVESSGSSPIIMEEDDQEILEGEHDSPRKRKRPDSDIEESPAKLRRAEKEPLSGEEDESEFDEVGKGNRSSPDDGLTSPEIDMNNRYSKGHSDEESYSNIDAETFTKLCALKERIMLVTDNDRLQEIVEVISDTGLYGVSKTFDFDLGEMDQNTVEKLQEMLPPLPSPPPPPEEIYEEEEEEIVEEEEEEEEEFI